MGAFNYRDMGCQGNIAMHNQSSKFLEYVGNNSLIQMIDNPGTVERAS